MVQLVAPKRGRAPFRINRSIHLVQTTPARLPTLTVSPIKRPPSLSTPSLSTPSLSTPSLSTPSRAEQESDADRERERRVGPLLQGLVDGVDHVVADLAHRVDRLLPLGRGIRHHSLDI